MEKFDWKVLVPGIGLLGLAIFQASTGDYPSALQTIFAALAAFGIKVGYDRNQRMMLANQERLLQLHQNVEQNQERLLQLQNNVGEVKKDLETNHKLFLSHTPQVHPFSKV